MTWTLPEPLDVVDGERFPPEEMAGIALVHPDTGEDLQAVVRSPPERVAAAARAAEAAQHSAAWKTLGPDGRAGLLDRFASELDARSEELAVAEVLCSGVPIDEARRMTADAGAPMRDFALLLRRRGESDVVARMVVHRRPWGPAVLMTPWAGTTPSTIAKAAAALAAGCPVILHPSYAAPAPARIIAEAAMEADLPPGVVQLVHGDDTIGGLIAADARIRVLVFIGARATGRALQRATGPNLAVAQMELGGNPAAVVCADADIADAAAKIVRANVVMNGQWGRAPGRILAHADIHDELRDAVVAELAAIEIGDATAPGDHLGPIPAPGVLTGVQQRLDRFVGLGGTIDVGGLEPGMAPRMRPTLVSGVDASMAHDECYAPVLTLHRVGSDDEALADVGAGDDGTAASVFGTDLDAAADLAGRLHAAEVTVNGFGSFDVGNPEAVRWWGSSVLGVQAPFELFEFFRSRAVVRLPD